MKLATVWRVAAVMAALGAGFSAGAQAQTAAEVQILSATVKDKAIAGAKVTLQRHGQQ